MLSNNGLINGRNDGPILSIIQPITIDTILNNNGLNNKHELKKLQSFGKKYSESRITSIGVSMKHC